MLIYSASSFSFISSRGLVGLADVECGMVALRFVDALKVGSDFGVLPIVGSAVQRQADGFRGVVLSRSFQLRPFKHYGRCLKSDAAMRLLSRKMPFLAVMAHPRYSLEWNGPGACCNVAVSHIRIPKSVLRAHQSA